MPFTPIVGILLSRLNFFTELRFVPSIRKDQDAGLLLGESLLITGVPNNEKVWLLELSTAVFTFTLILLLVVPFTEAGTLTQSMWPMMK